MILRLSRIRQNDPMADPSLRRERKHVASRRAHAGPASPPLFTGTESDVDLHYLFADYAGMSPAEQEKVRNLVERVRVELAIPSAKDRLAWNAEDPLASVHYYMVNMRVLVPLAFGIRMCFRCPNCNIDLYDGAAAALSNSSFDNYTNSCQNFLLTFLF